MKSIEGYHLIKPEDLTWRPSNLMRIPNADYLERTGSENLGARLWRMPPKSANTLHRHVRAEEFYFVLEGTGRMRVGEETLTVPRLGGVLVGPAMLRQVFNDTDSEVLWLIVGAPEAEFEPHEKRKYEFDLPRLNPRSSRRSCRGASGRRGVKPSELGARAAGRLAAKLLLVIWSLSAGCVNRVATTAERNASLALIDGNKSGGTLSERRAHPRGGNVKFTPSPTNPSVINYEGNLTPGGGMAAAVDAGIFSDRRPLYCRSPARRTSSCRRKVRCASSTPRWSGEVR